MISSAQFTIYCFYQHSIPNITLLRNTGLKTHVTLPKIFQHIYSELLTPMNSLALMHLIRAT